jgi:hypothetical protein
MKKNAQIEPSLQKKAQTFAKKHQKMFQNQPIEGRLTPKTRSTVKQKYRKSQK